MYVIPQEGQIAHDSMLKQLDLYGYHPSGKNLDYVNTKPDQ